MNTRNKLEGLGLDYKKLAGFFNLTPKSFLNSSARKRYEEAALKIVQHLKNNSDAI